MQGSSAKTKKTLWAIYWIALFVFALSRAALLLGEADEGRRLRADGFVLLLFAILGAYLVSTFLLRPRMQGTARDRDEQISMRPWHLVLLAVNSLYCFWVVEYVNNEQLLEMKPFYVGINLLGIFLIHLLLLGWLNSVKLVVIVALCFWSTWSGAFYLVYAFRGEPLQPIDFLSFWTAMTVTRNYTTPMPRSFAVIIILWVCILGVYLRLPWMRLASTWKRKLMLRLVTLMVMIGGWFFYTRASWNGDLHIKTDLFAPIKTYKQYGSTVGFFCVGKYMRLLPPEGYSVNDLTAIAERVEAEERPAPSTDVRPVNIITIMNEGWADYSYAGNLQTNMDPMPYYHSMEKDTIRGYNLVCITGGGTAKTEYEFLTGNSVKRFPGMVPYVSYFRHNQYSLVSTLKAQGYRAIAMHPYKGSNWKRPSAYRLLDFDAFLTEEDFPETAERYRSFISDRANYEKILDLLREKEDPSEPLFLFNITMQNHSGFTNKSFYGEVKMTSYESEDEEDVDAVERYLSLSKVTDNALAYLIESLRDIEEPTIVLMFGDHYPSLPESFVENLSGCPLEDLPLEEQQRYYATPFFIWANYDLPEQQNVLTSTNFLGTILLDQTALAQAPYNRYLHDLMQTMPALNHKGYVTSDGKYVSWDDATEPYTTMEWEYECLQYNELAEKRNRLDEFFSLEETS